APQVHHAASLPGTAPDCMVGRFGAAEGALCPTPARARTPTALKPRAGGEGLGVCERFEYASDHERDVMNEATWPRTLEAWGVAWAEHTGLPSRWVLFVVVLATGFLAAIVARSLARQLTLRGGRLVARFGPVSVQADFEHLAGVIGRAAFWLILLLTVMV